MRPLLIAAACLALAGCSKPQDMQRQSAQKLNVFDVAPAQTAAVPAAGPRIAYSYAVTYRFDRRNVAAVQAKQIELCHQAGPAQCQLVKSSLSNGDADDIATSETSLLVDARLAASFNARLDAIATGEGATVATRATDAEDVTKQNIDIDARVRAKQALTVRLLAIIQNRAGKVGELVEAEQAYAKTQEELDAARGEQAALRQRVAMSGIDITYSFDPGAGGAAPIRHSLHAIGETLATSVAALITFLVAAAPWLLIVGGLVWVRRRMGWRWPFRDRPATVPR